ncbi:HNH endonuclease signature motif containing protein [Proteiniphilum sp.]|nr:HNH endonuclease signature motif containing protein [Proteiniphilum sp.]MEA4918124.1 HNH endonuclease signature motif containing protein [Proteiniphilum sp.]
MMKAKSKPWTLEELDNLKKYYPVLPWNELLQLFPGRTKSKIKNKVARLGLKRQTRFWFTKKHIDYLVKNYSTMISQDIADKFGCSLYSIYNKAYSLGLEKDKEFMANHFKGKAMDPNHGGRKYHFEKGHEPFNKGMKLDEYMSPEAIEKSKATRFQSGHKPHNTGRDGEVRWRPNCGYYYIRIKEGHWMEYHRYLWEQKNGPIPKGYNIFFKDGNRRNCTIENLECISNAELARRNTIHNYPSEVKDLFRLRSSLSKAIKKSENI